jgi:nucleoside diphosphate kinase
MDFIGEPIEPAQHKHSQKLASRQRGEGLQAQKREQPVFQEVIESISAGQFDERHPGGKRAIGEPKDQPGVAEKEHPPQNTEGHFCTDFASSLCTSAVIPVGSREIVCVLSSYARSSA